MLSICICIYRRLFRWSSLCFKYKVKKQEVPINQIPWLSIGTSTNTHTELVNKNLRYGVIDKHFLQKISGDYSTDWVYLDSRTLEEKEFPSSGILIQHGENLFISDSE
jgi:hypothetical protein